MGGFGLIFSVTFGFLDFQIFNDAMRCLLHVLLPIPNVLLWFGGKLFICAVLFVDECLMSSDV